MSRGEDVLLGDDGSSTNRGFVENGDKGKDKPNLPGVLMDLGLYPADDPRRSVGHTTVAVFLLRTIWKPGKY